MTLGVPDTSAAVHRLQPSCAAVLPERAPRASSSRQPGPVADLPAAALGDVSNSNLTRSGIELIRSAHLPAPVLNSPSSWSTPTSLYRGNSDNMQVSLPASYGSTSEDSLNDPVATEVTTDPTQSVISVEHPAALTGSPQVGFLLHL